MQANRWHKTPPTNSSWIRRCMKLEGQLDELVQAHVYYNEVACVFVCICLCFLCLLCHSWALESVGTEAKQNGVARLKAVLGPAASVFNHRFTPNQTPPPPPITLLTPTLPYLLTPLHADQAAVKEAMHPATPTHPAFALISSTPNANCAIGCLILTLCRFHFSSLYFFVLFFLWPTFKNISRCQNKMLICTFWHY